MSDAAQTQRERDALLNTPAGPKKRRWGRVLLIGGGVTLVAVAGLALAAPTIASSFAPGIIAGAAKGAIQGPVKVGSVSLSWGGPQKLSGIELSDPAGQSVGRFDATASAGLFGLLTGGKDLGTLTLAGDVTLERDAKGETNLQRAIAPFPAAAKSAGGAGAGRAAEPAKLPAGYTAKLELAGLNVRYREVDSAGKVSNEAAISGLKGEVVANTGGAGAGVAMAQADVEGQVDAGGQKGALNIKLKIDGLADANGVLQPAQAKINADIQADKLPVGLIDALANQSGLLLGALGETLAVDLKADTQGAAGSVTIRAQSPNLSADMALGLSGGRLTAARPGSFVLRSTKFAENLPAVRDGLAKAGVSLSQWPSVEGALTKLDLPAPTGGQKPGELDFRRAAIELDVKTTAVAGTFTPKAEAGQPAPAARAVALSPATLRVVSADLAKGVQVEGATQATLDGRSAGSVQLSVLAEGLADGNGRLASLSGAGAPFGKVDAKLDVQSVSAEVLQPFVSAAGLPIVVSEDLGSAINVQAAATTGAALKDGTQPIEAQVKIEAGKLVGTLPVWYTPSEVRIVSESVFTLRDGARLASRFLDQPGQAPAVNLSGAGDVTLRLSNLSVPMAGGQPDLAGTSGDVRVALEQLSAGLPNTTAGPVEVRTLNTVVTLRPGQPVVVESEGNLSHEGRAFSMSTKLGVANAMEALKAKESLVPGVGRVRANGAVMLNSVPMSLAALRPAGEPTPGKPDLVGEMLRGVVGQAADVFVRLDQPEGVAVDPTRQAVDVTIEATGLRSVVAVDLNAAELRVRRAQFDATVTPDTARGLLRAAGQDGGQLAQVTMAGPAKVRVAVQPMTLPLKAGALAPDWARAGVAQVDVTLADTLIVQNIPAGDRRMNGGVRNFGLSAKAPLSMLGEAPSAAQTLEATLKGELLLDERTPVGMLAGNLSAAADQSRVDASVGLTGVNTQALDGVLGQPLLASGALGNEATILAKAVRTGGKAAPLMTSVVITSPQLRVTEVQVALEQDRLAFAKPTRVDWTMTPAFADRYVLAGKDEQGRPKPATMRLLAPAQVSLDLTRFAIALPKEEGGRPVVGPLKPGVFALEASAVIPRLEVQNIDPQRGAPTGPPTSLRDVTATVRSDDSGAITLDAKVGSLASGNASAQKPLVLNAQVRNLADANGVLAPKPAETVVVNLTAQGDGVSTAVLDNLADLNGQLVKTLGTEVDLNVKAVNASRRSGDVDVDIRSRDAAAPGDIARVKLAGPIDQGALRVSPGTPFSAGLSRFQYDLDTTVLKMFPLFASVRKATPLATPGQPLPPGSGPSMVSSPNLVIPVDGDMRKFNGDIAVDLGVIEYKFADVFGQFLDNTLLASGGQSQLPIQPFTVQVRDGVASYDRFDIPIRNFVLKTRGRVDLVNNTVDVVTYIPTVAASKGLLSAVNGQAGKSFGKVLPETLTDATMIPIRARGPMNNPQVGPDFELFFKEFGDSLIKQPEKLIEGVLDLLKPKGK